MFQRPYNVLTLERRCFNVKTKSCAGWYPLQIIVSGPIGWNEILMFFLMKAQMRLEKKSLKKSIKIHYEYNNYSYINFALFFVFFIFPQLFRLFFCILFTFPLFRLPFVCFQRFDVFLVLFVTKRATQITLIPEESFYKKSYLNSLRQLTLFRREECASNYAQSQSRVFKSLIYVHCWKKDHIWTASQ